MRITEEALNEAIEGKRELGEIGLRLALKELRKLRDEDSIPNGYALVPIEPTENMIIAGFESKPSAFNSSLEEVERCEAMSGCEQAGHRAKLCWKAMVAEA
ncbi:hypothetical protein [Rosenbergiella nectarea]|uniref:hypothetical protein n=1 Tax=Rosenbergiella nectarea TaxID=988801 RepID=UPI001F4ECF07|nr:hypothetical protein [Rosenbergiella nectarea]